MYYIAPWKHVLLLYSIDTPAVDVVTLFSHYQLLSVFKIWFGWCRHAGYYHGATTGIREAKQTLYNNKKKQVEDIGVIVKIVILILTVSNIKSFTNSLNSNSTSF